ncbi:MAG TPA: AAA family ATPase [Kitasatospora aureofaciens]|nr:AAA family ATPase [Kitasatospora aureofaciens]HJD81122.1 AAA family ATPase [Kitasatospora aureofaciens]
MLHGPAVATVRAGRDRAVYADPRGVLLVRGGPGSDRTTVALNCAPSPAHAHGQLSDGGILVVSPAPAFLRRIRQVLPALNGASVMLLSIGDLYPGISWTATESAATSAVKGDVRMAEVLATAIRATRRLLGRDLTVYIARDSLFQMELRLDRALCARAMAAAVRHGGGQHNRAREIFAAAITEELACRIADRIGFHAERWEVGALAPRLLAEPELAARIEELWPTLTPETLVARLLTSRDRLAEAGAVLSEAERRSLLRARLPGGSQAPYWTPGDIPLLDEAAELLGPPTVKHHDSALRAAKDRTADGPGRVIRHVIVDEAQELSTMAWRMLLRRCPSPSMTVVGEFGDTGGPTARGSWQAVLDSIAEASGGSSH